MNLEREGVALAKSETKYSNGEYSVWQILDIANAYYVLSQQFTNSLPKKMAEVEISVREMGPPVASAMNRIFALELYLKALLVAAKDPFPLVHDLVTLFLKQSLNQYAFGSWNFMMNELN